MRIKSKFGSGQGPSLPTTLTEYVFEFARSRAADEIHRGLAKFKDKLKVLWILSRRKIFIKKTVRIWQDFSYFFAFFTTINSWLVIVV